MPAVQWGNWRWTHFLNLCLQLIQERIALFKTIEGVLGSTFYSLLPGEDITNTYALWKKPGSGKGCTFDGPVSEENHLSVIKTCFSLCSLSPGVPWEGSQRKACLSLCSLFPGVPREGSQGKDCLSLCSLFPGVPWEGPRGRTVCLYVVCTLMYPEKGPKGRTVCLYVVCLYVVCPLV